MPKLDYNRYAILKKPDGSIEPMSFVDLPVNTSDKYIFWSSGSDRLDKLSQKYYNNPFYDFLISYANNEYTNEFDIPDNALIRIPFPLERAIYDYELILKNHMQQFI